MEKTEINKILAKNYYDNFNKKNIGRFEEPRPIKTPSVIFFITVAVVSWLSATFFSYKHIEYTVVERAGYEVQKALSELDTVKADLHILQTRLELEDSMPEYLTADPLQTINKRRP